MEKPPASSAGFISSLRTLGDGLVAGVEERLELFSIELQEEKFRLIQTFVWISAAVFTGMMTITFASLTLVYFFWESGRLAVRKLVLRRHIVLRRVDCIKAAAHVVQPLEWLDRILAFWRGLSPLAKAAVVPPALVAQRVAAPRLNLLGSLVRWGPLAFAAIQGLRATKKAGRQTS